MWRGLLFALLLAGCAQLPPSPEDVQAKKFESLPDKAVVYIVRTPVDSVHGGTLWLDDNAQITTWQGTYYRWEVAPGAHRIASLAHGTASVRLSTEPGRIYFVRHTVTGPVRAGPQLSFLEILNDREGRELVRMSQRL